MNTSVLFTQDSLLKVIMFGGHPDDCDINGGGTALLYVKLGHKVKFVSVTNGDAGHMMQGGGVLAKRRTAETQESARKLGVTYQVLDNHDGELMPTLELRKQIIRLIREWGADVVITHRPYDYHPDHRYVGELVQDAAFLVSVPNIVADTPPIKRNPIFLYFKDHFQKPYPFSPDIAVDITNVMEEKFNALEAFSSQFYEWLPWINGYSEEIPESEENRKEWLLAWMKKNKRWSPDVAPGIRECLIKWYGEKKASKVKYSESFEVCEYGRKPTEDVLKELFPMLGK